MLGCETRPPGFKARLCSLLAVGPLAGDLLSRACFLICEHLPQGGCRDMGARQVNLTLASGTVWPLSLSSFRLPPRKPSLTPAIPTLGSAGPGFCCDCKRLARCLWVHPCPLSPALPWFHLECL